MKRLTDIQRVNDAEIELIKQQSALLLIKQSHGFGGELKSSGAIIENYVKGLLQKHLPDGYKICSGYIATSASIIEEQNLIQHDIIIVDGRIPSLYVFGISDIEVVPAEAVCGIIEVKRTLTKASFLSAHGQLKITKELFDVYRDGVRSKSKAANNAAGPTMSVATRAPLYGVIALDSSKLDMDRDYCETQLASSVHDFIDLIWCPAASFLMRFVIQAPNGNIYFPTTVSRNCDPNKAHYMYDWFDTAEQSKIYGRALSCYRSWITNTSGMQLGMQEATSYFGAF